MTAYSHIRNPEKYFNRTVQEWHATRFGRDYTAIDLDLGGYCRRCYGWLYFIESAEVEKYTGAMQRLALQAGAVALVILHRDSEVTRGRRVHPSTSPWMDEQHLAAYLTAVRDAHARIAHGEVS